MDNGIPVKWPGNSFSYRADVQSFTVNLPGAGLTQAQARWWINYSLAGWKTRTGADLSFTYSGDFTGGDDPTNGIDDDGDGLTDEGCITSNGINEVVAGGSCASWDPGCTVVGLMISTFNGSGSINEADVCVFGPAKPAWGSPYPWQPMHRTS